jgi:hypothetical protein
MLEDDETEPGQAQHARLLFGRVEEPGAQAVPAVPQVDDQRGDIEAAHVAKLEEGLQRWVYRLHRAACGFLRREQMQQTDGYAGVIGDEAVLEREGDATAETATSARIDRSLSRLRDRAPNVLGQSFGTHCEETRDSAAILSHGGPDGRRVRLSFRFIHGLRPSASLERRPEKRHSPGAVRACRRDVSHLEPDTRVNIRASSRARHSL